MKNTAQHKLVHPTTGNVYVFIPRADGETVEIHFDDENEGPLAELDGLEEARAAYRRLRSLGYEAA